MPDCLCHVWFPTFTKRTTGWTIWNWEPELYKATGDNKYLAQALEYGRREPVTLDGRRQCTPLPMVSVHEHRGHYHLAKVDNSRTGQREFIHNMRTGIERTYEKAVKAPFCTVYPTSGVPTI